MVEISHPLRRNLLAPAILIGAIATAAVAGAYVPLEHTIAAFGVVAADASVKKIRHPVGGVVGEIRVTEGARVSAGDLLIRLDDKAMRSSLDGVREKLIAARARLARLGAFRDGTREPAFPQDLKDDVDARSVIQAETRLARLQLAAQEDKKRALFARIERMRRAIAGLEGEQPSGPVQPDVVRIDLQDLTPRHATGDVQNPRVSQRELLRNRETRGDPLATIVQLQAKIAETELQIAENDDEFGADTVKQLHQTETEISELRKTKTAIEDLLERLEIRAPLSGVIRQLAVHTIGEVISPSDVLMHIVPSADQLLVAIRIKPSEIDRLSVGQDARVRLTALGRSKTEELAGALIRIAPDPTRDEQGGHPYYAAAVRVSENELARFDGREFARGMPAYVFIRTGKRSLVSYVAGPLRDQMKQALRAR